MRTLLCALVTLSASTVLATPEYPGAIEEHLAMTSSTLPMSCNICHQGSFGAGTVRTPFGTSLRMKGLVSGQVGTLKTALDTLAAEKTDSDGDRCPDIDELKSKPPTNPNSNRDCTPAGGMTGGADGGTTSGAGGGAAVVDFGPVKYGCGANVVPGGLGLLALLALRRRFLSKAPKNEPGNPHEFDA
jgi:hypothetical protein